MSFATLVSMAAEAALLVHLLSWRPKSYRWLMRWAAFSILRTAILLACGNPNSKAYGIAWIVSEPIVLWWYLALTIEWHNIVLSDYPEENVAWGETLFRWGISGSMLLTGLFTFVLITAIDWPELVGWISLVAIYKGLLAAKSWIAGGAALFLLGGRIYWKFMPRRLPSNRWRHSSILIAYCAVQAFCSSQAAFVLGSAPVLNAIRWVGSLASAIACICWVFFLRKQGEALPAAHVATVEEAALSRARLDDAKRALQGFTWPGERARNQASRAVDRHADR